MGWELVENISLDYLCESYVPRIDRSPHPNVHTEEEEDPDDPVSADY